MRFPSVFATTATFFFVLCSCGDPAVVPKHVSGFEALSGPYLGQRPPGEKPQIFLPGLISSYSSETYIVFLNDAKACVYSTITAEGQKTFYTYEEEGSWTAPRSAPFEELQGHPNYTTGPEGRRVYFHSGRPTDTNDRTQDDNVWAIEWTGNDWAEPYALPSPPNSDYGEAYPTISVRGTVYFFSWKRSDTRAYDIYRSRLVDGQYQESERLGWPINTDYIEFDPYVAPDESYLVFGSGRPGGYGESDNYICFRRDDGSWTHPANLGPDVNSASGDLCANGTADGKYFFFASGRNTEVPKGQRTGSSDADYDLYWVDTSSFAKLEKKMMTAESAAEAIKKEYQKSGLRAAIDTLERLYSDEQDRYYFSSYELLSLCESMLSSGEVSDAEQFQRAIADTLPSELRIKEGFAQICMLNDQLSKSMEILRELDVEDPSFDLERTLPTFGYLLTQYPEKADDALKWLHLTVEEFPDSSFAYFSLAKLYRDRGDVELAIKHCKKCLELKPNDGDAASLLNRLEQQR